MAGDARLMGRPTTLSKKEITAIAEDYGLPRVTGTRMLPETDGVFRYLVETAKGKFLLTLDDLKTELEAKREIDLLLFLRKHGFPCMAPLADRKGRYSRDSNGRSLCVARYVDGRSVESDSITVGQLENLGRVLADLHLIGKNYKKGIDNRFSFERMAETLGAGPLRVDVALGSGGS